MTVAATSKATASYYKLRLLLPSAAVLATLSQAFVLETGNTARYLYIFGGFDGSFLSIVDSCFPWWAFWPYLTRALLKVTTIENTIV